jgi:PAS domain S-box-containing protein
MKTHLQVLIVEDSEDDMLLTVRELRRGGYTLDYVRVDTALEMTTALDRQSWDLAIADYTLPEFSGPAALEILQNRHLDLPFIIVSGTIGEEVAVGAMKAGAHDYIIKGNLTRLVPAVARELREAEERHKRHLAETALRARESELRESEARYRLLFESNPHPMWVFDVETLMFLAVNPAAIEHYGYSEAEFMTMTIADICPPQDIDRSKPDRSSFNSAQKFVEVWKHHKRDGSSIDVEVQIQNCSFAGKQASLLSIHDITDRLKAEQELYIQSSALESAVEGISKLDANGCYSIVNAAYAGILGYSPAEMVGMNWIVTIHAEDRSKMLTAYQYMLEHGKVEVEARGIRKDGSSFYKQLVMVAAYDKNHHLTGHHCFSKDITERQQIEALISEQAALLDVATDAITVRDLNHNILFWNKGAERIYGWEKASALGKKAVELLFSPGEPRAQFDEIQAILLREGQWQGELQHISKDAKKLVLEARWTLVRDEAGNPKSILTVSTDITAKKQLEAQFLRAQRLESLGTLASGIAHDFNNILTPILAGTQLIPLRLTHLDSRTQQLLNMMENSAKRGADLVKQILAFASGVEGKQVSLQVRHLLAEVLQVARQTFPKTTIISRDIPETDIWTVSADPTQLHQVFMNLCVNARDAMPEGGMLSVVVANQLITAADTCLHVDAKIGAYVTISIRDTGTGIPAETLDRIFDPFFTTKEQGKGTGLGLSTVLGIVKNHQGFILVDTEVGRGTEFKVYLPAIGDAAIPEIRELILLAGDGESILIVDDELFIQQVTQTVLEEYNYRTLVASDGLEAIDLYVKHRDCIRVVLMDIMMPTMGGLTAIETIQQIDPHVKIVATSGLGTETQVERLTGMGVKAFLAKPYTAKELLDTLQKVLDRG